MMMSSAIPIQVPNAPGPRAAELKPYGGKALSTEPQRKNVTYRCRVYRYRCEGLEHDEFVYTMVNDTDTNPLTEKLPPGEPLFTFSGPSRESVREQMQSSREKLGDVEITSWRTLGSL
jgi:hypothetical protein